MIVANKYMTTNYKQCIKCGKKFSFDKFHPYMKYCSRDCSRSVIDEKYKLNKRKYKLCYDTIKKCLYCGEEFKLDNTKPLNTELIRQYCCQAHMRNEHYKQITKKRNKGSTIIELNLTEEQKQYITQRDNNACVFCHKTHTNIEPLSEVLLVPVQNGGKIDINNIFTCCIACKKIKSNKSLDTFLNRTKYTEKHNITRTTVNPIIFQTKGVTK